MRGSSEFYVIRTRYGMEEVLRFFALRSEESVLCFMPLFLRKVWCICRHVFWQKFSVIYGRAYRWWVYGARWIKWNDWKYSGNLTTRQRVPRWSPLMLQAEVWISHMLIGFFNWIVRRMLTIIFTGYKSFFVVLCTYRGRGKKNSSLYLHIASPDHSGFNCESLDGADCCHMLSIATLLLLYDYSGY